LGPRSGGHHDRRRPAAQQTQQRLLGTQLELLPVAALADGTIDPIVSDQRPRDADDTELPFARAVPVGAEQPVRGAAAEPCLFHPERSWAIEAGRLPGKAQNNPFGGRAMEGRVLGAWKAGKRGLG